MKFSLIDWSLWFASLSLSISIVAAAIHRGHQSNHPLFLGYMGFCAVRSVTLMLIYSIFGAGAYFYAYWSGIALGHLFIMAVTAELAASIYRHYWDALPEHRRDHLRFLLSAAAPSAIMLLLAASPLTSPVALFNTIRLADRSMALGTMGTLIALAWVASRSKIQVNRRSAAILYGLVAMMAVQTAVTIMAQTVDTTRALRPISQGIFILCELTWFRLFTFSRVQVAEITTLESQVLRGFKPQSVRCTKRSAYIAL